MKISQKGNFFIVSVALLLFAAVPCLASSFTADLVQSGRGKAHTSKFYSKDQRYRMDMVEGGQSLSILVDRRSGKTRIVVPSEKAYLEIANRRMRSITVYGTVIQDAGNGTTVYQKKKLESISFRLANGGSKMWPFPQDRKVGTIGINVSKGAANVRIEQPKKAGSIPPSWTNIPRKTQEKQPARLAKRAQKAANPNVIFILDASGSMWGQISGKPKIQIAKEVMNDIIDHLPPDMDVGLMAYGHRRKGDCHDIEMLVPVGKLDRSRMKTRINAINPKGKTPLSAAVKLAAEKLHYATKRATVVLVSDGLETCGGNPCKLAEKLAMSGLTLPCTLSVLISPSRSNVACGALRIRPGGFFSPPAMPPRCTMPFLKLSRRSRHRPRP